VQSTSRGHAALDTMRNILCQQSSLAPRFAPDA